MTAGTKRWFAVQISAGFDTRPAKVDQKIVDALWPWAIHRPVSNEIELEVWLVKEGGIPGTQLTSVKRVIDPKGFPENLRKQIASEYATEPARAKLDVRLLFPGETPNPQSDVVDPERVFPARVQYLGTLPGEVSARLLATVYLELSVDDLFTFKDANPPLPKADLLWIAPVRAHTPNAAVTITGKPGKSRVNPDLIAQKYEGDNALEVNVYGPGFALARLVGKNDVPIFDLTGYWMAVEGGDARLSRLEDLVASSLDPFAELEAVPATVVREKVLVVAGGPAAQAPADVPPALLELWRADAVAALLTEAGVKTDVISLALALQSEDDNVRFLERENVRALEPAGTGEVLLQNVASLAAVLGIREPSVRMVLGLVAARAGFAAAAVWLALAFTEVLDFAVVKTEVERGVLERLRRAWRFEQPSGVPQSDKTIAERRLTLAEIALRARFAAEEVEPLLKTLLGRPVEQNPQIGTAAATPAAKFLRDEARKRLEGRWAGRLASRFARALSSPSLEIVTTVITALKPDPDEKTVAEAFATRHLDGVWPEKPSTPRDLPGHGLPIVLGDPKDRLVHEEDTDKPESVKGSTYSEVAGIALLVRRGTTKEDVKTRSWRLVTGGACVVGSLGDTIFSPNLPPEQWLNQPVAIPLRPVFHQSVARADLLYHGHPMLTRDPLDRGYLDHEAGERSPTFGSAYTFESFGKFRTDQHLKEAALATIAPILRYGDWYQFAAGVVDQASGLPSEIAVKEAPWQPDVAKIRTTTTPFPQTKDPIHFPRTVSVGEVATYATENDKPVIWPSPHDDVSLRCLEWWTAVHPHAEQTRSVLLSDGLGARGRFVVHVEPPSVEEHTLVPWAAPALDIGERPANPQRKAVIDAYVQVLEHREKLRLEAEENPANAQTPKPVSLFHDPAVGGIGIHIRVADAAGKVHTLMKEALKLANAPGLFRKKPVAVVIVAKGELAAGAPPPVPRIDASTNTVTLDLHAGCFAVVECAPLVSDADFARFANTLFEDLLEAKDAWPGFRAFRSTSFLAETAIATLPDSAELFKGLRLDEIRSEAEPLLGGPVAVRFEAPANMRYVPFLDTFSLHRERWAWRNRPTLVPAQVPDQQGAERRRLLASGPPKAAFDPADRDQSPDVEEWEQVADLDRGFPRRGDHRGRWPRGAPGSESETGGPQRNPLLLVDDRDAASPAEYVRYKLTVRSRYAGILPKDQRERTAVKFRRIVVRSRASILKPPKVLAVIPLTRSLGVKSDVGPSSPTPFLVILDEVWFREYGVGERLDVRVALENLDIGEDDVRPENPPPNKLFGRPYRVGPLPDHHLPTPQSSGPYDAGRYFLKSLKTTTEDENTPERFDAFGPFGFTLDVSPDEALSNASAFVVFLHKEVGPHWAAFVRFRRVLEHPRAGASAELHRESESSDVHAVYTLPDAAMLASVKEQHQAVLASDSASADASVTLGAGVTWVLDPVSSPPTKGNSAAASRYRYFLMINRQIRSAAHSDPIEMPEAMWRLRPLGEPVGHVKPDAKTVVFEAGSTCAAQKLIGSKSLDADHVYTGRIVEVLLNGEYPGRSRLDRGSDDKEITIRDFWDRLLTRPGQDLAKHDAAGMIRRFSDPFGLRRAPVRAEVRNTRNRANTKR